MKKEEEREKEDYTGYQTIFNVMPESYGLNTLHVMDNCNITYLLYSK